MPFGLLVERGEARVGRDVTEGSKVAWLILLQLEYTLALSEEAG